MAGTITLPSARRLVGAWNLQFERAAFVDAPRRGARRTRLRIRRGRSADRRGEPGDPRAIPALNFHAAELDLGRAAVRRRAGDLVKLDDGIRLEAADRRRAPLSRRARRASGAARTRATGHIEGTLTSTDVQDTLKQLGYAAVIEAKSGRMDFDLNWAGAPTADALSQAARATCSCRSTRVRSSDSSPAPAGCWGSPALPRCPPVGAGFQRSDRQGLAFDTVHGDFDLRDGSAYTDNVLVKGRRRKSG